jgi:hypothetical protein
MNTSTVRVGQTVSVAQIIGNSGGPADGIYSFGPHIEVRWAPTYNPALVTGSGLGGAYWNDAKWVDSYGTVLSVSGGTVSGQGDPGQGTTGNPITGIAGLLGGLLGFTNTSTANLPTGASFTLPHVHISPTGDVTNFLVALDAALEIVNPFNVTNAQQDTLLGATFTDPISWIEGFGYNIVADLGSAVWRLFFILAGGYLIFKLASHFIDFSALAQNTVKLATTGAMLAA